MIVYTATKVDGNAADETGNVSSALDSAIKGSEKYEIGNNTLLISAGNPDYNSERADLSIRKNQLSFYVQGENTNDNTQIVVEAGAVTIGGASAVGGVFNVRIDTSGILFNIAAGQNKRISGIDVADNFADDTAAAAGNIPVGYFYHTDGVVKVRLV